LVLTSPGAYAFRRKFLGTWQAVTGISARIFLSVRLVFESPLPGLGSIVLGEAHPPPFSPSGICCILRSHSNSTVGVLEYSEVNKISSINCLVRADATEITSAGTVEHAKYLAKLLSRLKESSILEREVAINATLRKMLDTRAAGRRWRAYRRLSSYLFLGSWILFGMLVLFVVQVIVFRFRLGGMWPLAVTAVLLIAHVVCVFKRVHKILFPGCSAARWKQVILMILTPTTCIRVNDFLAQELFAGFHFLVVARVMLNEGECRKVTSRALRELTYPADLDGCKDNCAVSEWVTLNWRHAIERWIGQEFGSVEKLLEAPARSSPKSILYCPRCLTQYVFMKSHCSDCPRVSLQHF
jgi:hypothetical protein